MSAEAIAPPLPFPAAPEQPAAAGPLPTMEHAGHYERLELLRALGKGQAAIGNEDAALRLADAAYDPTYTDPWDEINLAIMDSRLASDDVIGGREPLAVISPNMQPWANLKLQKYGQPVGGRQLREYPLEEYWAGYNLRQQEEIIDDLLHIGDYDRALQFAWQMAPEADSVPEEREARRDTIIAIAHRQAAHGQAQPGLDALAVLRTEAEAALGDCIADRMNLPEYPSNPAEEAALAAHDARYREHLETFNLIEAHTIALRGQQSERIGRATLERAAFFGDDHRRTWRKAASRLLNTVLRWR